VLTSSLLGFLLSLSDNICHLTSAEIIPVFIFVFSSGEHIEVMPILFSDCTSEKDITIED